MIIDFPRKFPQSLQYIGFHCIEKFSMYKHKVVMLLNSRIFAISFEKSKILQFILGIWAILQKLEFCLKTSFGEIQ